MVLRFDWSQSGLREMRLRVWTKDMVEWEAEVPFFNLRPFASTRNRAILIHERQ
jgi:hypothetical protein